MVYKEQIYRDEVEISSLETCDVAHSKICNHLQLDPKRVLVMNEHGALKYDQWVESTNLWMDNVVYVVDAIKSVKHVPDQHKARLKEALISGGILSCLQYALMLFTIISITTQSCKYS